ncbi:SET domain-containing protein 5 [Colletotrichum orbiculare MAFF 240422]|uniref:SET domain-containing protein 5 n=1 Tax=Colletotrichum orbiculare (strain 104-T / ATCC 96160 / CBS 514.97 / LARS 414 / MAFF 240422) TaxID=1213857 RepID=A0A484FX58_COLOR|nr:SET domain-containing protein 5 [Colletotrichum orbiculare MAFF 240422]
MVRIRKNAYPLSIASVEHKTETLVDLATEDGNVSRESNLKPMATNLEAFQGHPELLKSVCLHAAGAESMLYLYNIVKEMVAGTCSMISEVAVFPNTQRLRINSPLKTTSHHVYKVATKHGELWAMDVTGAQHGHSNSLLPWPEYSLGAFPTQKPIDKGHIQLIAHELDLRIHELAAENGGHLEALLKGPLAPFQSATTRFLDQLEARVRAIVGNPSLPTEFSTMTFGSPEKPYCIRSTPGKGMGMFATRRIPRGTRILSESPVFKLPRFSASLAAVKAGINQSVRRLNDAQRESFYALHNAHGNNATEGGIFLEASRINHSCKQNAQNTWNGNLDQTTIHALKDIEEGEEITISYMGESGDYATRQAHLTASFHFSCICECCSLPEAERAASDERLDRMSRIDSLLGDGYGIVGSPLTHLGHAREMKGLMEQEGILDARVARLYYDAFQVAVANGDQARAKVFAERAHAERLVIEGEDGPETARVKQYVERPASHRLFGTTMKWKQHVAEIPQGLGEKEFEKWLWKS